MRRIKIDNLSPYLRQVITNEYMYGGGRIDQGYVYDAYGNVSEPSGNYYGQVDMLYTGHFHHRPSELHLAPYRTYDPEIGRWLSREPLGLDGPNLYHYVFNDPLNSVDPDGLIAWPVHGAGAGVGAVAGFCGALAPLVVRTTD